MAQDARWQQLEALFYAAVEVDPDERGAFLDQRCNGDAELRAEVESLLRSSEESSGFLSKPVLDVVKQVASGQFPSLVGTKLAQYEIISRLGAGGMGEVFLAKDTKLKRRVAIKILSPELTQDERGLRRFEQEAQAASALNHPNILTIFEFGEANGLHYIVSELVEGATLRQKLAAGRMEVATGVDIAAQIASALTAAHANGITHRDIKPENLMLRPDGVVKVLDFGIAKLTEKGRTPDTIHRGSITQGGTVVGTLKYMSPEQARGIPVDGRSDIFTLGVVFYEMLAGKPAFDGATTGDLIAEILKTDPPPLVTSAPDVSAELQRIISRAIWKDRDGRYQNVSEFSQDLLAYRKEMEFQAHLEQSAGRERSQGSSAKLGIANRAQSDPQQVGLASGTSGFLHTKAGKWAFAIAVLIILGATAFLVRRLLVNRVATGPRSLAILPFQNLRPDPSTDFLGFSLADAVTTKLSYLSSLTLRPSSAVDKYRNQEVDPQKVGSELKVDTLLTGSFLKDGDDLRINTQLIDVKADKILWREAIEVKYDKLLTVQDRVAQQIINGLELHLSSAEAEHLKPEAPVGALAYEYYLRGIDFYALNDFTDAIKMLEKSTQMQPDYAPAWAHLGRAYTTGASLDFGGREFYEKAQNAYEKAIALNPTLVEPRVYMGNLLTDTGRVEQAIPLLRAALQTSPNDAEAHWELGYAYRFGGMLEPSVDEAERARGFDPQVKISSSALNSYLYLGEYDKFLQTLPPGSSVYILFYRGFVEYHLKKWHEAADDFDRAYGLNPTLLPSPIGKALGYGIANQKAEGLEILHQTETRIHERGVTDGEMIYKLAQAYAALGDHHSALHMFSHAVEGGFFCYPYFVRDPLLDPLRNDPGFKEIMEDARQRHEQLKTRFF
jgi:serine/threonine protein kinase/TolB-like protein